MTFWTYFLHSLQGPFQGQLIGRYQFFNFIWNNLPDFRTQIWYFFCSVMYTFYILNWKISKVTQFIVCFTSIKYCKRWYLPLFIFIWLSLNHWNNLTKSLSSVCITFSKMLHFFKEYWHLRILQTLYLLF